MESSGRIPGIMEYWEEYQKRKKAREQKKKEVEQPVQPEEKKVTISPKKNIFDAGAGQKQVVTQLKDVVLKEKYNRLYRYTLKIRRAFLASSIIAVILAVILALIVINSF